jgi:hypothetical protein
VSKYQPQDVKSTGIEIAIQQNVVTSPHKHAVAGLGGRETMFPAAKIDEAKPSCFTGE